MKIISKIFIIIYLILIINPVFAIEKGSINLENNPTVKNTDKNINQALSIEKEVVTFRKNLILIQKKYKLENDKIIIKSKKDLYEIIYILRKIQTTKINKKTADNVIKIVINDLKSINVVAKSHLKNIKSNLDRSKIKYNKTSEKLNKILNKITLSFIKYYQKKENITDKDRKIIKVVKRIYEKSLKLKEFKNKTFYNKEDMKEYLVRILTSLKKDFRKIKSISKKR
jgi:hypothetical protein